MTIDERVAQILGEWRGRRDRGEAIDAQVAIDANPDIAARLRAEFATVQLLNAVAARAIAEDIRRRPKPRTEGDKVGPYRILELVGRGGTSKVYRAMQESPVRRQVAIKIIDDFLETDVAHVRFEFERESLALMDHPCIAGVLDAGVTSEGQPYVVMDYVAGANIVTYANRQSLDLGERLRMFASVCDAIHHAHLKGVIHRDIKPSNVLVSEVDGAPTPKVIDFGLAKALAPDGPSPTPATREGLILGTPAYMSPEQARGRPIDARTDVYSLGMLLYELLTNDVPWGWEESSRQDIAVLLRRVIEDEPTRPSTRLTQSAEADPDQPRDSQPDWGTKLRGDLDWIVLRALEKDPAHRYASAQSLAEDVRRHLSHEPVEAGPPTKSYRLRKFVRRHRVSVALSACLCLALVGGLAATTHLYLKAEAGRRHAERSEEREARSVVQARRARDGADQLATFLLTDMQVELGRIGKLDLLEKSARNAVAYYASIPLKELDYTALRRQVLALRSLGDVLHRTGHLSEAEHAFATSIKAAEALPEDRRPAIDLAYVHKSLGMIHKRRDATEAERSYRTALEILSKHDGNEIHSFKRLLAEAAVHSDIGHLRAGRDDPPELALASYRRGIACLERLKPKTAERRRTVNEQLAETYSEVARVQRAAGDSRGATSSLEHAIEAFDRLVEAAPDEPRARQMLARAELTLAGVLADLAQFARALPHARRAIQLSEQVEKEVEGSTSIRLDLVMGHGYLGDLLRSTRSMPAAISAHETAVDRAKALSGEHPASARYRLAAANARGSLAVTLVAAGRKDAARMQYEASTALLRSILAATPRDANVRLSLGRYLMHLGDLERATAEDNAALDSYREAATVITATPDLLRTRQAFAITAAGTFLRVGEVHETGGKYAAALGPYNRARGIINNFEPQVAGFEPMIAFLKEHTARSALLSRSRSPESPADHLSLAYHAMLELRNPQQALPHFEHALSNPAIRNDLEQFNLYNAACAAALVANDEGSKDEKASWTSQAIAWLREDLSLRRARIQAVQDPASLEKAKARFARTLKHLREDPDLTGLRGLPEFKALLGDPAGSDSAASERHPASSEK